MRVRSVAVGVVLSMLLATVASAQLSLGALAALGMLTTKKTSLKKVVKNLQLDISPVDYSGPLVGIAGGIVVTDAEGMGPNKPPLNTLTVEVFQRNANGSMQSLGKQNVAWGEISIPGVDPDELGLPDDLPLALLVAAVPPPPNGATNVVKLTANGGAKLPAEFAIVPAAAGIDVSALGGIVGPELALAVVDQFLRTADQMVNRGDGKGLAGILPR